MDKRCVAELIVLALFSLNVSGCKSCATQNTRSYSPQPFPPGSPEARLAWEVAELGPSIHDPSELQYENGYFMTFSTGKGIRSWYRDKNTGTWQLADIIFTEEDKPQWWDEVFPLSLIHI